jgi:HlyD family secretion protein
MKAPLLFPVPLPATLLLLTAIGSACADDIKPPNGAGAPFRTAKIVRGKLTATVNATGTIEPEEVIDVGPQVTGQIDRFGKDPTDPSGKKTIDYGTQVEEGMILAHLDDTLYKVQVVKAEAGLKVAEAAVKQAEAKKKQTQRLYERTKAVFDKAAVSQADLDQAEADADAATAGGAVAQAAAEQAKANLKEAKINLGYCTITSPVKGVIIDRRVNVGQTVVASLSAPNIFLIAKDLMRLQVWASVNEADIGAIHAGQEVTFTVDARPGKVYHGTVQQIRYNATMTQNVVTYTVVVSTENKVMDNPAPVPATTPAGRTASTGATELELMSYLTANLTFHVAERPDALLVPNAALRWRPQLSRVAPDYRDAYDASQRQVAPGESPARAQARTRVVWVEDQGFVRPIKVVTGLTDGTMTEVIQVLKDDKLEEGTPAVTGDDGATNPLAPKIFAPKKDDK